MGPGRREMCLGWGERSLMAAGFLGFIGLGGGDVSVREGEGKVCDYACECQEGQLESSVMSEAERRLRRRAEES